MCWNSAVLARAPDHLWLAVYDGATRSSRHAGAETAEKAVAVNKRHDFARLEREYVTTDISIRGLCRKHNITAHSLVTVQARKHKWQEKREAYRQKAGDAFIERYADRMADR